MVTCDHCRTQVPIAPMYYSASVPHVVLTVTKEAGQLREVGVPCRGNSRREQRDFIEGKGCAETLRLVKQHEIFQDDRWWEL